MKPGTRATAQDVLRQRAVQLARPPARDTAAAGPQALEFSLGERRCLLEVRWLREVLALRDVLPVPMAAPSVLGLVHWHGRMLPVLNLAALLAIPVAAGAPAKRLLVLAHHAPALALAVSEIHGLQPLHAEEVERRSQPLDSLRPEIVSGLTRDGHLLLDGERLLSLQRSPGPEPFPTELQRQDRP